ncbi:hypothetical protein Pcinc_013237 [Petrolisthes cinctipes]|uniref:Uncharacterized protein n=1 Tax=Petrolisthes cinctipes TaxID=88211 RepID=A0AAE1FZ15_PETCI|nr:hypothetical protein Pcinc_013237 [Petrolisthes cinctipes]
MSTTPDSDVGGGIVSSREGVPAISHEETIAAAKRRRATEKGFLTKQMGILDKLTDNINNVNTVREIMHAFPRFVDKFNVAHVELLGVLTEQEQVTEAEQYKVNLMDQVMTFEEGLHNWIAQHETEEEEESEQARESLSASGPHTAESDQDSPIYTDKVNTHLEAENKTVEDEIMELSTKQQTNFAERAAVL